MPEKGTAVQEILLGMGLSHYLYLTCLLQWWDKADDLFLNWPRAQWLCSLTNPWLIPSQRLSVVYSMYHFPFDVFHISVVRAIEKLCVGHHTF